MSAELPTKLEKCRGAVIATAIGDALGWPNEVRSKNLSRERNKGDNFVEWMRFCRRPCWHDEKVLPGEYSDDTQMTLSVARSIIAGNWEDVFIKKELPFWIQYERGGGRALLQAANSCKKGIVLWKTKNPRSYFNAGGNGSVMRILPHVIASVHSMDIYSLMTDVIKDSIITHGHPRAILGATCYAFALEYLLRKESVLEYGELVSAVIDGKDIWGAFPDSTIFVDWLKASTTKSGYDYTSEWDTVLSNMLEQFEYIKLELKKGLMSDDARVLTRLGCFSNINGAGDVAIMAAIYLLSRYANNPILGIKVPALSIGADTDTIASITGGLLGMLCGINWIPTEWRLVQDYECLNNIAEMLFSDNKKETAKNYVSETKEKEQDWENSPIGLVRKLGTSDIESGKNRRVLIKKYQSALGQTMYFKNCIENKEKPTQNYEQLEFSMQSVHDNKTSDDMTAYSNSRINVKKKHNHFELIENDVRTLLQNPLLKKKTFGKILQTVKMLLDGNTDTNYISKELKIEKEAVENIKRYIK